MKIIRPDHLPTQSIDNNHSNKRQTTSVDFKTVLEGSMDRPEAGTQTSKNAPKSLLAPLAGITPLSQTEKTNYIDKIETFLDVLESYQKKLADQGYSLRDIGPVVEQMAIANEAITDIFDSLPDSDGFKQVANQTVIVSSVEIAKFNRGDYLDG